MDCIFCKIINGEIPSKTLYEDDIVKVIMDANPNSDGHTLILPKKHFTNFEEMDNKTLSHINDVAKQMKKYLFEALNPDGMVLVVNYGEPQIVKHYHLHLIPTYPGLHEHKIQRDVRDLDEVFNQIKDVIEK